MTIELNQKTNQALLALGNRQDARHIRQAIQESRTGGVTLVSYANSSGFVALPGSAEQLFSDVVRIPAYTLKPGDKFQFVYASEDAGTADAQIRAIRARIHTSASVLAGNVLVNGVASTASNTKCMIDKTALIVSSTKSKYIAGLAGSSISTTAFSDTTIDCTVDQYIGLTIQNANTLVNHLVYHASLVLEPA